MSTPYEDTDKAMQGHSISFNCPYCDGRSTFESVKAADCRHCGARFMIVELEKVMSLRNHHVGRLTKALGANGWWATVTPVRPRATLRATIGQWQSEARVGRAVSHTAS